MTMSELYIGLMSGTSLDGADVVLVEFDRTECIVHDANTSPFPQKLTTRLRRIVQTPESSLEELGTLDVALGRFFAESVRQLVDNAQCELGDITAIGFSGHTIFHKPALPHPFTMQLGDPNVIASATGINTVADFRRMDMAQGGQGAPLTPTFHAWRFSAPDETRVVVNLGGVANITVLSPGQPLAGFDTGPANSLMDGWCRRCWEERYDEQGRRARSGSLVPELLAEFLADPYFQRQPPKSTGFEYFNLRWVEDRLAATGTSVSERDVLTTLAELTAISVSDAIRQSAPDCQRVILCGGGTFNPFLVERLEARLPGCVVEPSASYGIGPEWVEAVAFAWLAQRRLKERVGNASSVTGARQTALLGGLYLAEGGE
ncbi:MAG: anhydro-N-acetylmuramic acid kinase [Gammaproteobacteria bacterium]